MESSSKPRPWNYSAEELARIEAAGQPIRDGLNQRFAEIYAERNRLLDEAATAAIAAGIPASELWLEVPADRAMGDRLMRHPDGPPQVGEVSRGKQIRLVWLEPDLVVRATAIDLGEYGPDRAVTP